MSKGTCLSPGLRPAVVGNKEYALEVKLNRAGTAFAAACPSCSLDRIGMVPDEGDSKVCHAGAKALHSRKRPVDLV